MKTKALLLAAVLFAAGTTVSFAANDNKKDNNCKDKTECAKANKDGRKGKCGEGFNPFEGLNLTEAQQTKLQELRNQECPMKAQMKGEKKNGQKVDKEQARTDRSQAKREFLGKVKAILTPEQYVTFLENMAVNGQQRGHGNKQMMKQKDQKQSRDQKQGRDRDQKQKADRK